MIAAEGGASTGDAFPWADAAAFGLGVLRLSPADFWAMTLPDLRACLRGMRGQTGLVPALTRPALATLMARYPDGSGTDERNLADG